jgi:hypothetical protein
MGSPHKKKIWFGGDVHLYVLSILPQMGARIMQGIGKGKLKGVDNEGKKYAQELGEPLGRKFLKKVPAEYNCFAGIHEWLEWLASPDRPDSTKLDSLRWGNV